MYEALEGTEGPRVVPHKFSCCNTEGLFRARERRIPTGLLRPRARSTNQAKFLPRARRAPPLGAGYALAPLRMTVTLSNSQSSRSPPPSHMPPSSLLLDDSHLSVDFVFPP